MTKVQSPYKNCSNRFSYCWVSVYFQLYSYCTFNTIHYYTNNKFGNSAVNTKNVRDVVECDKVMVRKAGMNKCREKRRKKKSTYNKRVAFN